MGTSLHTLTLKADGSAWTWGNNTYGQLGNNGTSDKESPVSVIGGHSFIYICTGGFTSYGLKSDGTAWTWGYNDAGQLGDNSVVNKSSPVSVLGDHSFTAISAGCKHCLALKSDGTCWGWGDNTGGQLGTRSRVNKSSPVSVVGDHVFSSISAGGYVYGDQGFSCGLKASGQAWTWGYNSYGQLGIAASSSRSSPVAVVGSFNFTDISAGEQHVAAIDTNTGTAWAWGYNLYGQLGQATAASRSSPVSVVGAHSFTKIMSGGNTNYGFKSDGSIWSWGVGAPGTTSGGELGDNTIANKSSPVSVVGNVFSSFTAEDNNGLGLKNDGSVWAWGSNYYRQIGDNTVISKSSPVVVAGSHVFSSASFGLQNALAIKSNGECWGWGRNELGQLGIGSTDVANNPKVSPVSVIGGHAFSSVSVAGGYFSFALKSNGEAWAWGNNADAQLGDNSKISKSSPVSVVGNHIFSSVCGGGSHGVALKSTNGSVWAWGLNSYGQLGDNSRVAKSSPVAIVGSHSFASISCGANYSVGLKSNTGAVWTWGQNDLGQLGDMSVTSKSSPVLVVGNHSFTAISCAATDYAGINMALKADGSVWCWGWNNPNGSLGDGTIVDRSSPVSVIGNHSFIAISSGRTRSFALKSDGSVWAWGQGNAIGDNTIISRSSPVPVVGNHSFSALSIRAGSDSGAAIKANGEIWTWGLDTLGDNVPAFRTSPVPVIGGHIFVTFKDMPPDDESSSSSSSGIEPCVTWGDNTSPNTNIEWTRWTYFESATEARNTGAWGELELRQGDSFVSNVIDSGGYRGKIITISYSTAIGAGSIYYRVSNTPFGQADSSPSWISYSTPVISTFRYYQIRVDGMVNSSSSYIENWSSSSSSSSSSSVSSSSSSSSSYIENWSSSSNSSSSSSSRSSLSSPSSQSAVPACVTSYCVSNDPSGGPFTFTDDDVIYNGKIEYFCGDYPFEGFWAWMFWDGAKWIMSDLPGGEGGGSYYEQTSPGACPSNGTWPTITVTAGAC